MIEPQRSRLPVEFVARLPAGLTDRVTLEAPWVMMPAVKVKVGVWSLPGPYLAVAGDLVCSGTVVVGAPRATSGFLVVTGSVRCRNLLVQPGFSLVCGKALAAREAIVASNADSTTHAGGRVIARLLVSGHGAWLSVLEAAQLGVKPSGFAMVGNAPLKPSKKLPLDRLVKASVLDDREWRRFTAAERREAGLRRDELVTIDVAKASRALASGQRIVRARAKAR